MANADRFIELFNEAKARPAGAERERFLAEACPGEPELKQQVISLLQAHEGAGSFLKHTLVVSPTPLVTEKPGDKIGRYKLLQVIGEGGCGVVYMAEQDEPVRRKVALKVIKLGMDTKSVIARFEAERQALALMDHPNIARVFDAGATDLGRPYFVMELVRGIAITEYCDQNNLSTTKRLDLFIQVCQAIQHAHQKGIIHRDIKPSNILVSQHDTVAVPKVIDFGIAKATSDQRLTDKTLFTAFEQFMGTPAYMSSEQAQWSGLDIDTRTDIYSLGVLLYELLTGQTPFDAEHLLRSGLDEMRRIIREEEPPRPSTRLGTLGLAEATELSRKRQMKIPELAHGVRGDLDWIVMKCLEKDRTRRYETANGLAADLKRHLENEPVMARPPSTVYRFQKAFRRNKLAVSAAAAVGIALVVGVTLSTWQAIEASRARNGEKEQRLAAQTQRDKAQKAQKKAEQQTQRAQESLTRLEIERAESMLAADSPARAIAYLARLLRQAPTNRIVGERLLSGLSARNFCLPSVPPLKHESKINCAQFSPDGELVITASVDGTARIWGTRTGQLVGEPLRHEGGVNWAQFSPDARRVVTASVDGTAQVWDPRTGQPATPPLRHQGPVLYADFSPDGSRIVTGSEDRTVRLWDAETGSPIASAITNTAQIYFARFSPDGREILTAAGDGMARIFSCATTAELVAVAHHRMPHCAVPFPQYNRDGDRIVALQTGVTHIWEIQGKRPSATRLGDGYNPTAAVFSGDGRLMAVASMDNTARIRDVRTGQSVTPPLGHNDYVLAVQFSPDGTLLLTGAADGTARVWDVRTGKAVTEPLQHGARVMSVAFAPDSRQVLTLTDGNEAVLWTIRSKTGVAQVLRHKFEVHHAAFSPDGRSVATASWDRSARVWDAETGWPLTKPLKQNGYINYVRFSPNGQLVATASDINEAQIWDSRTGAPLVKPKPRRRATYIDDIHFSPDGRTIAMATSKPEGMGIWDTANGLPIRHFEAARSPLFAVFSPEGDRLLSASRDGTAHVWDAATGQLLAELLKHGDEINHAEFSLDGTRVVTASRDKTVRIWDSRTGRMLTAPLVHADIFSAKHSVQFSPDGRSVVTASGNAVQVWDASTAVPLTPRMEHPGRVTSVRFSPDGERVVSADFSGQARIWDSTSGHALSEPLRHGKSCFYAEFGPDGNSVITASGDNTAAIWWVPRVSGSSPDWLPELAEALAGRRMDDMGSGVIVPVENLFRLRQRLGDRGERGLRREQKVMVPLEAAASHQGESAAGADMDAEKEDAGSDYYASWAQWFFAEGATRTISPLSFSTVSRLESSTNALELAHAARSLASATDGTPEWLKVADSLSGKAAVLAPNEPEILQVRADVLKRRGDWPGALAILDQGIGRLPANPFLWKTKGTLMLQANRTNDALSAFSRSIELAVTNTNTFGKILIEARRARSSLLKNMNRLDEATTDDLAVLGVPPRSSQTASPNLIDLSRFYTAALHENWYHRSNNKMVGRTLAGLPLGRQTFDGIDFDVRGIVQLSSTNLRRLDPSFPSQTNGIPMGLKCRRLHFLQATCWGSPHGTAIGSYVMRYADGQRLVLPINYAEDVLDWWYDPAKALTPVKRATVAWTGRTPDGDGARLFKLAWENPRPDVEIQSIDFLSSMTDAAPFLIAITAE